MSLINQMLQDLDKRGRDGVADESMYSQTRAVSLPAPRRPWRFLFVILLGVIVAWLLWSGFLPHLQARKKATAKVQASASPSPKHVPAQVVPAPVLQGQAASDADNLPAMADLPLLLKLSSGLDNAPIIDMPVAATVSAVLVEKKAPTVVIAKVERILPESATRAASISSTKAAAHDPVAVTAMKEITPEQQGESEYRQATLLQQQGRTAEAIAMLEQALKSDPKNAAARQSLITLLLENKRHDDAIRWLQQSLGADKKQPGLAMILARLQVEKGRVSAAIETLQRTLPEAQERADYLAFLAALHQREFHHKEAAELYRQALKKTSNNGVWWMGLGISLQADGHMQEALDAFVRAKSASGLSPDLLAFVEQKILQINAK